MQAQPFNGVVTGRVSVGEAWLPLAAVSVSGSTKGTTTGMEGRFTLNELSPGIHEIMVTYLGHQTLRQSVVLSSVKPAVHVLIVVKAPPNMLIRRLWYKNKKHISGRIHGGHMIPNFISGKNLVTARADYQYDFVDDRFPSYLNFIYQETFQTGVFIQIDWDMSSRWNPVTGCLGVPYIGKDLLREIAVILSGCLYGSHAGTIVRELLVSMRML